MTAVDDVATGPGVVTPAAWKQLRTRLERETTMMIALAERIGRDGLTSADLTEYGALLSSVEELRRVLRDARRPEEIIVDDPAAIQRGDDVEIVFDDGEVRHTLVHAIEACPEEHRLSVSSPLGRALMGARVGRFVRVDTPAGPYRVFVRSRRRAS